MALLMPDRRFRHQRNALGQRARTRHQFVMRHHLVDHADTQRLVRVEVIARQRPAIGCLPAAQVGEQIGRVRHVTNLRLGEHRLVGRDRDVGGKLVPESAAHGPAIHRRYDRLAEPPHMLPLRDMFAVVPLPIFDELGVRLALRIRMPHAGGRRRRLIIAGAKRRAGPGEDNGADTAIRIGLVHRLINFRLEAAR